MLPVNAGNACDLALRDRAEDQAKKRYKAMRWFSMPKHTSSRQSGLALAVFAFIVCCYIAIYFILGEKTRITVWDTLDGFDLSTLVHSGYLFAPSTALVPQFFNGIPRSCFASELHFTTWIFALLPPFYAIAACKAVAATIAFVGTNLLLRRNIFQDDGPVWISAGVSACMATLPTYFTDISSAAVPLLLYVFLNIRRRKGTPWNWLILSVAPFFVSFVTMGMFFIITIGVVFLYDCVRARAINWPFVLAIFLYGVLSLLCEYRLLWEVLSPSGFASQRIEFAEPPEDSLAAALLAPKTLFLKGQEHAQSLHRDIVLPVVCIALLFWRRQPRQARILALFLGAIAGTAFLGGFVTWRPVATVYARLFAVLPMAIRFYWLYPAFWYISFGIALYILSSTTKYARYAVFILVAIQLAVNFRHHEQFRNAGGPTFSQYFAQQQFTEMKNFIGLPQEQYRVVSVGIYPAVASYNGFYTLDGYLSLYPLAYKKEFRQVIAPELARSPKAAAYFDDWGSRVYVFSSELFPSYVRSKGDNPPITLHLDYQKLYGMGCRYVISAVPIRTEMTPQLVYQRAFRAADSYWDIYLYKVSLR